MKKAKEDADILTARPRAAARTMLQWNPECANAGAEGDGGAGRGRDRGRGGVIAGWVSLGPPIYKDCATRESGAGPSPARKTQQQGSLSTSTVA